MRLVVLSFTVAVFLIVIVLLYQWGQKKDHLQKRIDLVNETEHVYSDTELKKSFYERVFRPLGKQATEGLRRMAGKSKASGQSKANAKLEKQIKSAGIPITAQEFSFIKSLFMLVFLFGGVVLYMILKIDTTYRLLILIVMVCIPSYGATFFLRSRIKSRKESITHDLPDVLDLLVVSVEAGLGLDAAIVRQYSKNKSPLLTELNSAIREVQMGVSRKTALRDMADRCDVKQLTNFVTALLQADQLGVSIKSVLTLQSERLRVERKQILQAKAAKAPIKILLPTVMFIFPVIFVILLGPAVVDVLAAFR